MPKIQVPSSARYRRTDTSKDEWHLHQPHIGLGVLLDLRGNYNLGTDVVCMMVVVNVEPYLHRRLLLEVHLEVQTLALDPVLVLGRLALERTETSFVPKYPTPKKIVCALVSYSQQMLDV
jgi:hypothetical protein